MISDPLTVITIVPLAVSLALLILPKISGSAEGLARASRAISMGVALAMLAITTMIFFGEIGNVDWTDYNSGYSLTNDAFALIPSIGVQWKVGADALSFPMIWLTTLLIPISMLVEWDAKKGHLFHPLIHFPIHHYIFHPSNKNKHLSHLSFHPYIHQHRHHHFYM